MIEIKDISKVFSEVTVLKGINLKFESNTIYTVIGGSGHGKTVLLKCIIGLLKPEKGKVFYDGVDFFASDNSHRQEVRKNMGVVFQGNALFDSLNVEDNISFPLNMFTNMSNREKKDRINEVLEEVNLKGINKKYPSEISGGMKKRVAIARAIATRPEHLFFDEPNSGLDPNSAFIIDELIYNYNKKHNITCVINTHDMDSVKRISDKVVFIKHGSVVWFGDIKDIKNANVNNKEVANFVFSQNLKIE